MAYLNLPWVSYNTVTADKAGCFSNESRSTILVSKQNETRNYILKHSMTSVDKIYSNFVKRDIFTTLNFPTSIYQRKISNPNCSTKS